MKTKALKEKKHQTARLNFIFKPQEKQILKEAADKANVTLTAFIKGLAIPIAERIVGRKVETF
jgi:uncharacterized protein (DUF1778 family)